MDEPVRAMWAVGPGRCALRAVSLPPVGPAEVWVRVRYGAVSKGTEGLVLAGRVPQSQWQAMRGPFQEGEFSFPVKYGYLTVGQVVAGALPVGQWVFCLHPHQEAFVVPAARVVPLPAGTPPERAVLGAQVETALNGLWDSGAGAGDRVTVVGGGVVGCLTAWLAGQLPGAEVCLVDVAPARASVARALGVDFCGPEQARGDQDVVIHASGAPDGLRTALSLAGAQATVCEMSWYGDRAVSLPLGEAFHSRRLVLRSSQVGALPAARARRWTHRRRMKKALELAADPRLDVLFTSEGAFEDLPADLPELVRRGGLAHRVVYDGGR